MADSSASTLSVTRSRSSLRYSLRALLILVTLAGVGLWYWFRVPFARERMVQVMVVHDDMNHPIDPIFQYFDSKQMQRYRRVLIGEPIREGLTELYYPTGERLGEENWCNGVLHGPWVRRFRRGHTMERGAFIAGKKHGLWELFDRDGTLSVQIPYDRGAPHGLAKWFDHGTAVRTLRFDHGEVTHHNGRQVFDGVGRAYRMGQCDDPVLKQRVVDLYFGWFPSGEGLASTAGHPTILKDCALEGVAQYVFSIRDQRVNVVLSRKCNRLAHAPASLGQEYMPAGAMLLLVLEPHDLVATYRHGCIWITTKEDAQNCVDRSVVTDLLKSPPVGVSQHALDKLRRNLDRPVTVHSIGVSAAGLADHLRTAEQLDVSWVGTADGPAVANGFRELPLRHVLEAICDQHHLRVRWGENASMVLELQDEASP